MPTTREFIGEARIKNLATNIRKRRRWVDMTQVELAKVLNTTQQRIAQFEKGDAVPNVLQAENIADALDTTIDRLLHED